MRYPLALYVLVALGACSPSATRTANKATELQRVNYGGLPTGIQRKIDEVAYECQAASGEASKSYAYKMDANSDDHAKALRDWIAAVGTQTAYIEPGSPWENGYCESFNSKLRDELLNGEVFYTLREAAVLIEDWRRHFNTARPHSSLGYLPPAPETIVPSSGPVAPWPGTPASKGARPANPDVALPPTIH